VRVLVADAFAARAMATTELIEAAGARAHTVASRATAIAEADRARAVGNPYDVIIVDQHLPEIDGIETARSVLERKKDGETHSAIMTGAIIMMLATDTLNMTGAQPDASASDELHGFRYLVKPAKRGELIQAIAELTNPWSDGAALRRSATAGGAATPHAIDADWADDSAAHALRILLADDSADNRLLIDAYLKSAPYKIDHAENGQIAIEMAKSNPYDLVLMDIQMPVVDGYKAVATIRQWESMQRRPRMPIIALTASALDDAVRRSIEAGCDAHVSKPVKKKTLVKAIRNATAPAFHAGSNGAKPGAAGSGVVTMKRSLVHVDTDLSDLIPGFLEHKRADAVMLTAAINQGDYDTLAKVAHKIKGEGGSYGFNVITEIGAAIERAGAARDPAAARTAVQELRDYLDSVEVVYE
jgi:CheY-like chemotaxis protein/HPt (histidine-containing phosphotransfer) domain-containing protein